MDIQQFKSTDFEYQTYHIVTNDVMLRMIYAMNDLLKIIRNVVISF